MSDFSLAHRSKKAFDISSIGIKAITASPEVGRRRHGGASYLQPCFEPILAPGASQALTGERAAVPAGAEHDVWPETRSQRGDGACSILFSASREAQRPWPQAGPCRIDR